MAIADLSASSIVTTYNPLEMAGQPEEVLADLDEVEVQREEEEEEKESLELGQGDDTDEQWDDEFGITPSPRTRVVELSLLFKYVPNLCISGKFEVKMADIPLHKLELAAQRCDFSKRPDGQGERLKRNYSVWVNNRQMIAQTTEELAHKTFQDAQVDSSVQCIEIRLRQRDNC